MTTNGALQTRVKRLEGGGGVECPECGFDGDWSKVRTVVDCHSAERNAAICAPLDHALQTSSYR
jgi:hypothetical protein